MLYDVIIISLVEGDYFGVALAFATCCSCPSTAPCVCEFCIVSVCPSVCLSDHPYVSSSVCNVWCRRTGRLTSLRSFQSDQPGVTAAADAASHQQRYRPGPTVPRPDQRQATSTAATGVYGSSFLFKRWGDCPTNLVFYHSSTLCHICKFAELNQSS